MHWKLISVAPFLITAVYAADMSLEAIQARTAPIGEVKIEQAQTPLPTGVTPQVAPAIAMAAKGKSIYESACVMCHATGAAGAPLLDDAQAWAPRIAKGEAVLVKHVIAGFNLMPARGTCVQCSDDDIKAAVRYIIEQVKR